MQPQFKKIAANGAELHYVERGRGDPVVLVHGAGATDLRTWAGQLDSLAARHRVIAYSQRYHYPNAWAGDGSDVYSTRTHAADLAALIRGLRLAPCHVAGSSYGGDIALLLAARRPELVRTLVLGEPGLTSWLRRLPGEKRCTRRIWTPSSRPRAPSRKATGRPPRGSSSMACQAEGCSTSCPHPPGSASRTMLACWPSSGPNSMTSTFSCADAGRITAPTLLLTGDSSPGMFGLVIEELARCMPGCERATIPEASHLLHGMNPQVYSETVLAFLDRH